MNNNYKIQAPPSKPLYHRYAAGAPGDERPLVVRLAERIAQEGLRFHATDPRGCETLTVFHEVTTAALEKMITRAFEAGRAFQAENPNSPLG